MQANDKRQDKKIRSSPLALTFISFWHKLKLLNSSSLIYFPSQQLESSSVFDFIVMFFRLCDAHVVDQHPILSLLQFEKHDETPEYKCNLI